MEGISVLQGPRVLLRDWRDSDRELFRAMNADPRVMEHFPAPMTGEESDALLARIRAHRRRYGWGLWAVEIPGETPLAGFVGLQTVRFAPGRVEAAWRLAAEFHHQGYAAEAARLMLAHAFSVLHLPCVLAFTAQCNMPSRRLMQGLGMTCSGTFRHPALPPEHRLSAHVLFAGRRRDWDATRCAFRPAPGLRIAL